MYTWDHKKKTKFRRAWLNSPEVKARKGYLFNKQGGRCALCKVEMIILRGQNQDVLSKEDRKRVASMDHIVPLSENGDIYNFDNLRLICAGCNNSLQNKK